MGRVERQIIVIQKQDRQTDSPDWRFASLRSVPGSIMCSRGEEDEEKNAREGGDNKGTMMTAAPACPRPTIAQSRCNALSIERKLRRRKKYRRFSHISRSKQEEKDEEEKKIFKPSNISWAKNYDCATTYYDRRADRSGHSKHARSPLAA